MIQPKRSLVTISPSNNTYWAGGGLWCMKMEINSLIYLWSVLQMVLDEVTSGLHLKVLYLIVLCMHACHAPFYPTRMRRGKVSDSGRSIFRLSLARRWR